MCLLVAVTVALYGRLGAYEDVQIARAIASLESATPDEVTTLITRIEARSSERPQNLDYHSLLGEYYIATGNAEDALQNFEAILAEAPNAPDVLGRAAQAEFVANGQVLTPRAQQRAEQALASDPRQKSALATLAMGSFGAGQYLEAVGYMRVLRDLEVPGSEAFELMRSAIVEAERRSSESVQAGGAGQAVEPAASSVKLGVTVALAEGLAPEAYRGLTLFVIARPAGSQVRMPTAVSKQEVVNWPVSVSLSDANSMAGQALSSLERVDLEVQLSKTGQPGLSNALLTGALIDISLMDSSGVVVTLRDNAQ
jgi:cytochrome c-type biogenesis protein CcmH